MSDIEDAAIALVDAELGLERAEGKDRVGATVYRDAAWHDLRLATGRGCDCEDGSCAGPILFLGADL